MYINVVLSQAACIFLYSVFNELLRWAIIKNLIEENYSVLIMIIITIFFFQGLIMCCSAEELFDEQTERFPFASLNCGKPTGSVSIVLAHLHAWS